MSGPIQQRVTSAQADLNSATEQLGRYVEELEARRQAEFDAAGGCERCRGRGWVVTWDTLDMMDGGMATYGPCPETEANPDAHGEGAPFNHATGNKYDRWNQSKPTLEQTEDEQKTRAQLGSAVDDARRTLQFAEHAATPALGKSVRVIKGRKVAKGTEGRVFWTGQDSYRPGAFRVGLETADGSRVFTAGTNVEVIS